MAASPSSGDLTTDAIVWYVLVGGVVLAQLSWWGHKWQVARQQKQRRSFR